MFNLATGRWPVPTLLLFALTLRLGAALYLPDQMTWPDGHRYERAALALLAGEGYADAKDPPLQAIALAAVYTLTDNSVRAARIIWAVLGTVTCLVCFEIARMLFSRAAALLALAIASVYPLTLYISVLPEYPQALFALLLNLGVLLALRCMRPTAGFAAALVTGLTLGLACLAVPTALAFAALLIMWMVLRRGQRVSIRTAQAVVIAASCAVVIVAWGAWHHALTGRFVVISTNGGHNFYKGNCELMLAYRDPDAEDILSGDPTADDDPAWQRYRAVTQAAGEIADPAARDRYYYARGLEFIRAHPRNALLMFGRKFVDFWAPFVRTVEDIRAHRSIFSVRNAVLSLTYAPVLLTALLGVVRLRRHWAVLLPLYLAILSQCIAYTAVHTSARYRSPIDFLLIVLAAAAVIRMYETRRGPLPCP